MSGHCKCAETSVWPLAWKRFLHPLFFLFFFFSTACINSSHSPQKWLIQTAGDWRINRYPKWILVWSAFPHPTPSPISPPPMVPIGLALYFPLVSRLQRHSNGRSKENISHKTNLSICGLGLEFIVLFFFFFLCCVSRLPASWEVVSESAKTDAREAEQAKGDIRRWKNWRGGKTLSYGESESIFEQLKGAEHSENI